MKYSITVEDNQCSYTCGNRAKWVFSCLTPLSGSFLASNFISMHVLHYIIEVLLIHYLRSSLLKTNLLKTSLLKKEQIKPNINEASRSNYWFLEILRRETCD